MIKTAVVHAVERQTPGEVGVGLVELPDREVPVAAFPVDRRVVRGQGESPGIGGDGLPILPDGHLGGAESSEQLEVVWILRQGALRTDHSARIWLRLVAEVLDRLGRERGGDEEQEGEAHGGEWCGAGEGANEAPLRQWRPGDARAIFRKPTIRNLRRRCWNAGLPTHRQRLGSHRRCRPRYASPLGGP